MQKQGTKWWKAIIS